MYILLARDRLLTCQGSSQTTFSDAGTFEESLLLHLIKLVEQSTA